MSFNSIFSFIHFSLRAAYIADLPADLPAPRSTLFSFIPCCVQACKMQDRYHFIECIRSCFNMPASADSRMSRISIAMIWWSIGSALFYLILAAQLAVVYGTINAIIGASLAVLVLSVLTGIMAYSSARTGLGCSMLSQAMLGTSGGVIPTFMLCIISCYYAVFEGSVLAIAASKVIPGLSYPSAVALVVVYSAPLSIGRVQLFLDKLNGVLLPFYLLGLGLLVGLALRQFGYSDAWLQLGPAPPVTSGWWDCFNAYMGLLTTSMVAVEFSSHGRRKDAKFNAIWIFGVPFYVATVLVSGAAAIFVVGCLGVAKVDENAVIDACLNILGPGVGLAWIFVTQTRINSANYHIATENLAAVVNHFLPPTRRGMLPRWGFMLIVGLVTGLLMLSADVIKYLQVALSYQGVVTTAWVGAALVHITLQPAEAAAGDTGQVPLAVTVAWKVRGLAALLTGVAVGLCLVVIGGTAATLSAPVSLLISAGFFALLHIKWAASNLFWNCWKPTGIVELREIDVESTPTTASPITPPRTYGT